MLALAGDRGTDAACEHTVESATFPRLEFVYRHQADGLASIGWWEASIRTRNLLLAGATLVVVRHLARLHALEVALHLGVDGLAHITAHLAHPARHGSRVVLVDVSKTRFI